jgi:hypothetical protein
MIQHTEFIKPFNERGNINEVKNSEIWKLHERAFKEELTQVEKIRVFKELRHNCFSKRGIPLLGVMFDFTPLLKKYWIKLKYGDILEVYALNKTSIRDYYKSEISKIIEIE